MKKFILAILALLILSFVVSGCAQNNAAQNNAAQNNAVWSQKPQSAKVLSVNDVQADPSSFTGVITINGVMVGVSQTDSKLFGLVATAEVKACQSVGCGTFILPVKYDGNLPQVGDEVNVTGSFTGSGNDLVFKATSFKVLGNILPKGGK